MQRLAPRRAANGSPRKSNSCGPSECRRCPVSNVIGHSTARVPSMGDLPPPNTRRWVVRRKAAVVAAVRAGKITMEEALRRYQLTEEEFLSWQRAFETHGLPVCAPPAFSNTANPAGRAAPAAGAERACTRMPPATGLGSNSRPQPAKVGIRTPEDLARQKPSLLCSAAAAARRFSEQHIEDTEFR